MICKCFFDNQIYDLPNQPNPLQRSNQLYSSYLWIATMICQMIAFSSSKSASRSGLVCINNFWKFTLFYQPKRTPKKCVFFFLRKLFFCLFFFFLKKFNPYWLTQSQMLFFFFRHGKKKTAFLLTNSIFSKKCAKTNFGGEIKKYGTFAST